MMTHPGWNDEESRDIDWQRLAQTVGSIREKGIEHSSTSLAQQAIELIIGESSCRAAVDHYVAFAPGYELVRSILWHLHPWSAMERCYEIYVDSEEVERRRSAVELLRVVADHRVLPWVPEFLRDPDQGIQTWGAGIVDQLLFSDLVESEDCNDILTMMTEHSNEKVRDTYHAIQSYLRSR